MHKQDIIYLLSSCYPSDFKLSNYTGNVKRGKHITYKKKMIKINAVSLQSQFTSTLEKQIQYTNCNNVALIVSRTE